MHGPGTQPPPHPPLLELDGVAPESTAAFRAFMRTMHLHRQATLKSLAEKGRAFSQVGCLRVLSKNDGMSQKDLADMLHLSRPSITTMLHGLEEEGIISRRVDEHDRRLTRVYLTDKGREVEAELQAGVADYINDTIGALSRDEQEQLAQLLNKIADNIAATMTDPTTEEDTTMGAAE